MMNKKIVISNNVKELSDEIAAKSIHESAYFPIDRYFLNSYIQKIRSVDRDEFLLYNFDLVNTTYTIQLFLCLPELWEDITVEDLLHIINNFTNVFSFFSIITFTYRYLEIDILGMILNLNSLKKNTEKEIRQFAETQFPNFVKDEVDYKLFDKNILGIDIDCWMFIKQRLLLDKRIKEALFSADELFDYIKYNRYGSISD